MSDRLLNIIGATLVGVSIVLTHLMVWVVSWPHFDGDTWFTALGVDWSLCLILAMFCFMKPWKP